LGKWDCIDEAFARNKLGVINRIFVEIRENFQDIGSDVVNCNRFLANTVHVSLGCGASIVASVILPVVIVRLNDVPFAFR